jgi:hypothetical protein
MASSPNPTVIRSTHPEINAIDKQVMASDRAWFAKHHNHLVRIRRAIPGEFLVDSVAGLYGQRPLIGLTSRNPDDWPFVAVVRIDPLMGAPCRSDGTGGRMRFPVGHHPRSRRKDIEAKALDMATAGVRQLIRSHADGSLLAIEEFS